MFTATPANKGRCFTVMPRRGGNGERGNPDLVNLGARIGHTSGLIELIVIVTSRATRLASNRW